MKSILKFISFFVLFISLASNGFAIEETPETPSSTGTSVTTTEDNIQEVFLLEAVDVLKYNQLELTFSTPLDSGTEAVREFKITNKNDELDTFEVTSSELNIENTTKVIVNLDKETVVGNEYEVVVIALTNFEGNTIEAGVDNSELFIVEEIIEETTEEAVEEPMNEELPVETTDSPEINDMDSEENLELNSAATSTGDTTVTKEAMNTDSLPETGAEHVLLLLLSIILGTLIFIFKFKKA